jgi:hypothetical protein
MRPASENRPKVTEGLTDLPLSFRIPPNVRSGKQDNMRSLSETNLEKERETLYCRFPP